MAGAKVCVQFVDPEVGGRTSPVFVAEPYRPHFRVGNGDHLGVAFVGEPTQPVSTGVVVNAQVTFSYTPQVNYSALSVGAQFQIVEGNRVVGIGIVKDLVS